MSTQPDMVNAPPHYQNAPHGITGECIHYVQHMDFIRGTAFRYIWRAGFKWDTTEDLRKADYYIIRDITHGFIAVTPKPGYLTHALANGPRTLRRTILLNLWSKHDLTPTSDLLHTAIYNPARLDEEN